MQVKEANKLLKTMPQNGARKKVDGVPVFSSQNLDIAIATTDGIKWYMNLFHLIHFDFLIPVIVHTKHL